MKPEPFRIAKLDPARNLVFGYASVSIAKDGHPVEDLQHDQIEPAEQEQALYDFVLNSRETGEMHAGACKGHLVESCALNTEKLGAMFGDLLDAATLATVTKAVGARAWVGFKVDPATFAKVKDGTYRYFSIAGSADRVPVESAT